MTQTLLLDLDDTLLDNPLNQLITVYLKTISAAVAGIVDPQEFLHNLLAATEKMIQKETIVQTLRICFEADFYAHYPTQKPALETTLNEYYQKIYPTLRSSTSPRPAAIDLVKGAFKQGMQVVVATNPLFPIEAQQMRLEWANLPADKYPFAIVTSYEFMHFAKPNPAYFAEILARLGWPDQAMGMLGNSLSDDILPAAALGIPSFLILQNGQIPDRIPANVHSGTFQQAREWVERNNEPMQITTMQGLIAALKGTPAAMDTLLRQIKELPIEGVAKIAKIIWQLSKWEQQEYRPILQNFIGSSWLENFAGSHWLTSSEPVMDLPTAKKVMADFILLRQSLLLFLQQQDDLFFERELATRFERYSTLKNFLKVILGRDQTQMHEFLAVSAKYSY